MLDHKRKNEGKNESNLYVGIIVYNVLYYLALTENLECKYHSTLTRWSGTKNDYVLFNIIVNEFQL